MASGMDDGTAKSSLTVSFMILLTDPKTVSFVLYKLVRVLVIIIVLTKC